MPISTATMLPIAQVPNNRKALLIELHTGAPYRRHQVRRRFFVWARKHAEGAPQLLTGGLPLERGNAFSSNVDLVQLVSFRQFTAKRVCAQAWGKTS